jgi:DNA-binding NarL/FixJ family response regulator
MIRVLLADDQALVRGGLRMILDAHPDIEVVGEAADGTEVLELVSTMCPDVVLMDIRMPGLDGLEATHRLMQRVTNPPRVVILTTFDDDAYLYRAMRAGASGFLLKTAPPRQLVAAVVDAAAGDTLLAPDITRRLVEQFVRLPAPGNGVPQAVKELTTREVEVLRLIARGMSNAQIAAALTVSDATAKTHVARILTKLGLHDRVQAVVLAYESGLVRPGEAPATES